jgi:hypothetical protein
MIQTSVVLSDDEFRKALASQPDGNCVDCARRDGVFEVRDSKLKGTPYYRWLAIRVTEADADAYLDGVRSGFTGGLCFAVSRNAEGDYEFRSTAEDSVVLVFHQGEMDAFYSGVHAREFDAAVAV